MLSDDPGALPSPQLALDLHPPSQPVPVHAAHASTPQLSISDDGYVSPRQHLGSRASSTPGSPFQPSPKQPQQHQHGLNSPRPSLSPLSEYHSGFGISDEDLGSPSPSQSPHNPANHRRQYSVPNLLPLAFKSRTPSPTRKTHARSPSEQMPFTGDGRSNGRLRAESPRGGGLVSWLSGTAGAASALGLSLQSETRNSSGANGTSNHATPDTTPTRLRRSTNGANSTTVADSTTPKSTMTTASRFMSAISSRFNPTTPTSPATMATTDPNLDNDELYNLNIEAALFPHHPTSPSPSSPRDPFSPAAFKNLHMNAVGVLTKMQAAYRERSTALRDLQAERSAQRDELEEAETRARHLKMQLEDMAAKAQEHESRMRGLMEELAAERKSRAVAEKNLAAASNALLMSPSEGASMISEDLGVEEDRRRRRDRRRRSGGGGSEGTDEDEEEEDEIESAESESVFSRCRSPSLVPPQRAHTAGGASPLQDGFDGAGMPRTAHSHGNKPHSRGGSVHIITTTPKPKSTGGPPQQPMSAFQKILKGISGGEESGMGSNGCNNCKGQDASVAWDTVGVLRDENRHLKTRVGELEVAVEGALDLVKGIGL